MLWSINVILGKGNIMDLVFLAFLNLAKLSRKQLLLNT